MAIGRNLNDKLRDALLFMQAETPGLMGAVLVSSSGLTIVSTLPNTIEADVVAAMTASLLALGDRTAQELWQGKSDQVMIKGEKGTFTLVEKVNSQVAIVILASVQAKLGLVLMNMLRTSLAVAKIIEEALQAYPSSLTQKPSTATIHRFRRRSVG
jgi:hypothetical protein